MLLNKPVITFYLSVFLLLISLSSGWAQTKKSKDFFKIKTPQIKYVKPDTTTLIEFQEFPDDKSEASKSIFSPAKKLSIVSEDTTTLDLGEQSIVEMSEQVQIDSSWIKIAGYYAIWDTRSVNPYRMDGRQIKEAIPLKLVDEARNRFSKMPLESTPITSDFGFRGYRWHYGTDLDLDTGDSVDAAFDGVVRIAAWDGGGYGNYVVVRHYNGLETLYGHLSKTLVKVGQFVKAGQLLGKGGSTGRSTGPHLHYEVRYQGNPIDPERLYDFPEYRLLQSDFVVTSALFDYYNSLRKRKVQRAVYHTVRRGEVLGTIARRYHTSVTQLARLNRISTRSTIRAGRRLRVK